MNGQNQLVRQALFLVVAFSFISLQNCDWHKLMQRWDCFSIPSCMPYFPISLSYIFTMICLSSFISIQDAIYISTNVMTFYEVRKIETHNVYFLNKVGMGWKISLFPKCFQKDPIEEFMLFTIMMAWYGMELDFILFNV